MRIIALMNQKGGVGKTTTTVNLGAALAEQGKRVCLIDLDPQAHLTINYGVEPSDDHISLYDVLIDDKSFLEAVHTVDKNVALVASSIDLAGAEIELVSVSGRETLLKKKLDQAQHDFDFVLLDCPPSLGLLTLNALAVASEVIIPMQPHFLALQGVAKLLETVHLVSRRINPGLKVAGIVLTMYDAQTKLTSEVVAELNGFIEEAKGKPLPWANARVFNTKIRRNIKLAECPSFGQTILKYDGASNGAFDYRNLARELIGLPPLAAPVARPAVAAPAKPLATGAAAPAPALPPKPVMPPALVAAMKAQAGKKAAAAAAPAPAARAVAAKPQAGGSVSPAPAVASAKPQPTSGASPAHAPAHVPARVPANAVRPPAAQRPLPAAVTAPIPPLNLTPPPLPQKQPAPPRPAPAPAAPAQAKVSVTVHPTVDQSKLASATSNDNAENAA
jgi:chromosome partitioning protein